MAHQPGSIATDWASNARHALWGTAPPGQTLTRRPCPEAPTAVNSAGQWCVQFAHWQGALRSSECSLLALCVHRAQDQLVITHYRCYRNLIPKHKGSKDLLHKRNCELTHHLLVHRCCRASCMCGVRVSKLVHRNFPNAVSCRVKFLVTLQPRAASLSTRSLCRAAAAAQHAKLGALQL